MVGQEVFTEVGTEGGGHLKVDLKEGATLSASGVKEPESRPPLPSVVCDSGPRARPGLHLCCVSQLGTSALWALLISLTSLYF